jgi:hypothetical protein
MSRPRVKELKSGRGRRGRRETREKGDTGGESYAKAREM